jgi:DNA-binding transcriptional MerR regulator
VTGSGRLEPEALLTPGEVAELFRVDPKTVTRWDNAGLFPPGSVIRTLGGQRRFKAAAVQELLRAEQDKEAQP